jgi:hypothetical protein
MTTTIMPCSINIGVHCFGFKKQIFIEVVKANKATMMKNMFLFFERFTQLDFENYQVN